MLNVFFTNLIHRTTKHLQTLCDSPQIRRLRIEIEKLQWLHQQELSEMKHNLGKQKGSETDTRSVAMR